VAAQSCCACDERPRSQWRVRAGIAPDFPSPPTLNDADATADDTWIASWRALDCNRMTVNLTRIYTRLGDAGETHLGDMSRVPKTHPRIEAYGTVAELNARQVQNDLFDVGADLAVPHGGDRARLRVSGEQTRWLEERCDEVNATLPALKSFVIPGGSPAAAQLHVCRTVCRRAERAAIACGEELGEEVVRYLNRLSDLLFILSRGANAGEEPLWEPGRYR